MVIGNNQINNIGRYINNQSSAPKSNNSVKSGFEAVLQDKLNNEAGLKLSKHAVQRLQDRQINLTKAQENKIIQAVDKADAKGVKDSLIMVDNIAFVVNVKSRTVITAVNSSELKENVFTNIDGAVFI